MEPENLLLDRYILSLTKKEKPKICFVPTASGDALDYIARFNRAFKKLGCETSYLSLFQGSTPDLASVILDQDVIYVGGGNTRNLLVLWKEWGLDTIMRQAWESGIVLSGISAGSLCWFEEGVTDSIPLTLSPLKCLGFLKGSNCVHYDGEAKRRPFYTQFVKTKQLGPGLAAEDGVGLHFVDRTLHKVVASQPNKKAYRLSLNPNGEVLEEPITPEYLTP